MAQSWYCKLSCWVIATSEAVKGSCSVQCVVLTTRCLWSSGQNSKCLAYVPICPDRQPVVGRLGGGGVGEAWGVMSGQKHNKWSHGQYTALIYYMIHHSNGKEASFNRLMIPAWLCLTSSTEVLDSISCNARTDRDCSRMKQQIARSGGTFWNTGQPVNPLPKQ